MQIIRAAVVRPDSILPARLLQVDRLTLAKRLWRARTDDDTEFGFDLEQPLRHGDVFWQSAEARYVVQQRPEAVLEIGLDLPASAAAGIGWALGNLHLELCGEPGRLLALDEPAARRLLERIGIPFQPTAAIFRPGQFARTGKAVDELGPSHRH